MAYAAGSPVIELSESSTDASPAAPSQAPTRRWTGGRWLLLGVVAMILSQLALRAWIVNQRGLFNDDVMYGAEAMAEPLLSTEYLVDDLAGHFMPAAMLLHGVLYRLSPLEWAPFAIALMVLQLAASLAVLRLLRVLMGDRPALLVPLAMYLFCPVNLGPFTWWAAGMNSLPLQIGLAWIVADAVLLVRTGRRRYAVTGTIALLVTLLFYERAVLIPLLAFGLVAVLVHVEGVITPLRAAWHRGRALWTGMLLVLVAWAVAFVHFVPSESVGSATLAQVGTIVRSCVTSIVPALLGGPWTWFHGEEGGVPFAAAPTWATALGAVALAAVVLWSVLRLRGAVPLWALAAAYFLIGALLVGAGRGMMTISGLLPLAYRYFAGEAVVAAIVLALLFALPPRTPKPDASQLWVLVRAVTTHVGSRPALLRARRVAVPVLTVCFLVSSLYSTVTYMRVWSLDPSKDYLATAKASLANAGTEPLLDWNVPNTLIWGFMTPWNHASLVFGPLEDSPDFAEATYELRQLDDEGRLRSASVVPGIELAANPAGGCGWQVTEAEGLVPLDGSLFAWVFTAELSYQASADGVMTVAMKSGEAVRVPVRSGSHTVYVRLLGEGDALRVTAESPDLDVCIEEGVVGNQVMD